MGANTGFSGGYRNYYGISDGMLSANLKEVQEGFEEISSSELKQARSKVEDIDLRGKYVERDSKSDYKYKHYYSDIVGIINSITLEEPKFGKVLEINITDQDGEESILQTKFYGKYSEDVINRLLNADLNIETKFIPYAVPHEFVPEGKKRKVTFFYSGVALRQNGEKIEVKYDAKNEDLPSTERIKNAEGLLVTSRVDRVDFLWEKLQEKLKDFQPSQPEVELKSEKPDIEDMEDDDLPF